jgi:hypothetical protein
MSAQAIEIYPVNPKCPVVARARIAVLECSGQVREAMEGFVLLHAAVCPRCKAYNAAKGPIDG